MCGSTVRPASTAFLASRPAPIITLGFDVLVHDVMAAISTSPLPIVRSGSAGCSGCASFSAAARVGLLAFISSTKRGAPGGTAGFFWTLPSASLRTSWARARWRVSRWPAG